MHFWTSFSQNKPVLIGFFWDKLIKYAHNPIKEEHKLIKQADNPIKGRIICNIFFQQWKYMGSVKNFGRTSCNVLATHTRVGCTSNIVALHFSCEENGWTSCHNNCKDMSQLYSLSSPRIEIIKFSFSGTYEQSSVGLYFFDNVAEN